MARTDGRARAVGRALTEIGKRERKKESASLPPSVFGLVAFFSSGWRGPTIVWPPSVRPCSRQGEGRSSRRRPRSAAF